MSVASHPGVQWVDKLTALLLIVASMANLWMSEVEV